MLVAAQGGKMLERLQQKHRKPRKYLSVQYVIMEGRNHENFNQSHFPAHSMEFRRMHNTAGSICAAGICEFSTFL
jgi:hypothetical protein